MADPEKSGDEKKKKSAVRVHFLLPKGKSKDTCSDDLEEAFEQCDQNNLNPFWITEDKAFTLKPEKTVIPIFQRHIWQRCFMIANKLSLLVHPQQRWRRFQ